MEKSLVSREGKPMNLGTISNALLKHLSGKKFLPKSDDESLKIQKQKTRDQIREKSLQR